MRRSCCRAARELLEVSTDARAAYNSTHPFLQLVRKHRPGALDRWLEDAGGSGFPEFRSFETGLQRDKAAIISAVTFPYRNSQTEGQSTNSNA
ncbi:MAG: transposase [Chloroflexi bacterium]|nr:transposase [Chloroflexota bacterium]